MNKILTIVLLVIGGLVYNLAVSALSVTVFFLGIPWIGFFMLLVIPVMWLPLGIPVKNLCRKLNQKCGLKASVFFLAAHAPSLILAYAVLHIHDLSVFVPWNLNTFRRSAIELSIQCLFITAPALLLSVLLWYFVFDNRKPKGGAL